jgi:hypothetical protein
MILGGERIDLPVPFHHRTNTFNFFFAGRAANDADARVIGTLNAHALEAVLAAPDGIHAWMIETFHVSRLAPAKNCTAWLVQVSRSSRRMAHLKLCDRNPQPCAALADRIAMSVLGEEKRSQLGRTAREGRFWPIFGVTISENRIKSAYFASFPQQRELRCGRNQHYQAFPEGGIHG